MFMNIGDCVRWDSGSDGYSGVRRGTVVGSVPAGEIPDPERFPGALGGCGCRRQSTSYVVESDGRLFWPRDVEKIDHEHAVGA